MATADYKLIKSNNNSPLVTPAPNEGSHYYAFSNYLDLNNFTEVYTRITLPTNIIWTGNGITRNAYISLGIASLGEGYACDMGLCNWGGTGWRLCFGGVASGNTVIRRDHNIPAETKWLVLIAKNDKSYDTGNKSCMTLYAKFYGPNNEDLGDDQFSNMVPKCQWNRYYRFASLLHNGNNSYSDGTCMMGTIFDGLAIYNKRKGRYEDWGITSNYIENVWIVGYPEGAFSSYGTNSETFNINNNRKVTPDSDNNGGSSGEGHIDTAPPIPDGNDNNKMDNHDLYEVLKSQCNGMVKDGITDRYNMGKVLEWISKDFK